MLVDRRHRDQAAAAPLVGQAPRRALQAQERARQVEVERAAPVVQAELEHRRPVARARVVDEHVDAAERFGELVDDRRLADVGLEVHPARLGADAVALAFRDGLARGSSSPCHVIPMSNPRSASTTAVARPMPEFPPVMIATGMAGGYPAAHAGNAAATAARRAVRAAAGAMRKLQGAARLGIPLHPHLRHGTRP